MAATDIAVIDIGSNSIRYAEERDGGLSRKEIFTTRLGSGLSMTGMLAEDTMAASLDVIRSLADRARAGGFAPYAYATSAVRDAANGRGFADIIEAECGVPVEVLSGETEAALGFEGAVGTEGKFDSVLDIGGASMQIVTRGFAKSWRAGCVRCGDIGAQSIGLEGLRDPSLGDSVFACDLKPMDQRLAVECWMDSQIALPDGLELGRTVGIGGSITTLAALKAGLDEFDPGVVSGVTLSCLDIDELISRLIRMGGERKKHPLLYARHDVILYGAYVLSHALRLMGAKQIGVSCRDGMEGYLYYIKQRLDR